MPTPSAAAAVAGRTRVKFCGLVRPDDVDAAVAIGVDAIGFVFYPPSPRVVDPALAASLRRRLPSWVQAVGLFVNASAAGIAATHREVGLDVIQFHGDETADSAASILAGLGPDATGRGLRAWWKALRIESAASAASAGTGSEGGLRDIASAGALCASPAPTGRVAGDPAAVVAAIMAFEAAEHCLLDSASAGFGGSGHRFDWSLVPRQLSRRLILSGGLDADSVGQAIRQVRPFAVDTSSGIQTPDPRRKDVGRMERFMNAVQEADRCDPGCGTGAA